MENLNLKHKKLVFKLWSRQYMSQLNTPHGYIIHIKTGQFKGLIVPVNKDQIGSIELDKAVDRVLKSAA